jgi:hypothetical protein
MKLTLQIQLLPSAEQAVALRETLARFNEAANWLAENSADHTALALIKLAAGLAALDPNKDEPEEAVMYVALGCFHHTSAHGKAVSDFEATAFRFNTEQLPDKGQGVKEFWIRKS